MYTRSELLTRWPMLDVSARHQRLQTSLRLATTPIDTQLSAARASAARATEALWRRDPAAWSADAKTQAAIRNRLGWLTCPELMAESLSRLQTFAESIKRAGFTTVVLLGMGGSSLAPEVLRAVFGSKPGYPELHVLDSTDPAAVSAVGGDPRRTLYILASKSGTTIEPNSLAAYFRSVLEKAGVDRWADHFVAITDEGTELATRAQREGFRETFINPSDIGGRYSAVSFFGLVPAALLGLDLSTMVGWALAMLAATEPGSDDVGKNPAAALGLAMGAAAQSGRDKLTLVLPPQLETFGLWVEQLVAESTGKQGVGVVPIAGEPLGNTSVYSADRLFVAVRVGSSHPRESEIASLRAAGHPVVEIELADLTAIGAEFVRWEVATAIAGALLHINPFDEPNVQQAKDATRKLLETYNASGQLPHDKPDQVTGSGVELTLSQPARRELKGKGAEGLLSLVGPGFYFALLAYLGPDPALLEALQDVRVRIRDKTRGATMFGYGPRYLHSTGQLHKGGANNGVFLVVTATPSSDTPIPGEQFSFGTLELAQAVGDFASLEATGRRALHVHLPSPDVKYLREVGQVLFGRT